MATKAKNGNGRVTPEAFVTAWMRAKSYQALASHLGMSIHAVYQRGESYRRKGVKLPRFPEIRGHSPLPVAALNTIIAIAKETP